MKCDSSADVNKIPTSIGVDSFIVKTVATLRKKNHGKIICFYIPPGQQETY